MPQESKTLLTHVKEGFTALDLLKKVWWVVVGLIVFGSSLRGVYTFVVKDAPAALDTHAREIRELRGGIESMSNVMGELSVRHDQDISETKEAQERVMSELDRKLDYMVCSRRERDRERDGLPRQQNCEDIFLQIERSGGGN